MAIEVTDISDEQAEHLLQKEEGHFLDLKAVAITADSLDASRVDLLEIWESADDLDACRKIANAPKTGVQTVEVEVKRYEAKNGGPLF